jgi:hypothetical protein
MSARTLALALIGAAIVTSVAACQRPRGPILPTSVSAPPVSPTVASATPSGAAPWTSTAPSSATPRGVALTQHPCDLLAPALAKKYVGENAQQRHFYDSDPPVPVGDDGCYYTGDTRSVTVEIYPRPTDTRAPVNHFDVIRPQHRVDELNFEAYWFGPGEAIVAVKGGLLIGVSVASIRRHRIGKSDRPAGGLTAAPSHLIRRPRSGVTACRPQQLA